MKTIKSILCIAAVAIFVSCKTTEKPKEVAVVESYNPPEGAVIGTNIGNVAPDVKFNNPQDSAIALSSLRGHYVLLDFWASWCGPCRKENPNVVNSRMRIIGKKFKTGKGFKVFNVSLDTDKNAWKKAIKADNLNWPYHVSDLKGWASVPAAMYGVNSIPANYLIDPNGVIIAKDLRGVALEVELNKYVVE